MSKPSTILAVPSPRRKARVYTTLLQLIGLANEAARNDKAAAATVRHMVNHSGTRFATILENSRVMIA